MIQRVTLLLSLLCFGFLFGQNTFVTRGNASALGGSCYEVTDSVMLVPGAVWNTTALDLSQPFDINIDVMLGCSDPGADGMTFSLAANTAGLGLQGGFLGIAGVNPSFVVEFDTYLNPQFSDPAFDHLGILEDGGNDHNGPLSLAGPVSIRPDSGNIEDCQYHDVRITWDPATDSLKVYFDCEFRLSYVGDIAANIFGGNNQVFWGMTSGTGSVVNRHRFCLDYLGTVNPLRDTTICLGDTVDLNAGTGFAYFWSPATNISDLNVADPQVWPNTTTQYTVIVQDECGGQRFDTVLITVDTPADLALDLGNDTILCPNESLRLELNPTAAITWNDMSTADTFLIQAAGIYWAEKTNTCGTRRDSILVAPEILPSVNLGADQRFCDRANVQLDATFNSRTFPSTYLWQDNSTQPTFTVIQSGTYYVTVSNFCGSASDTVEFELLFTPPDVNFGPDQVLCLGDTLRLDLTTDNAVYLWSDSTTDAQFLISEPGLYWGERSNICGARRDSIEVLFDEPLNIDIGPDQALCEGEQTRLDMGFFPRTTYQWNNGARTQDILVTTEAMYVGTATNACGQFRDTATVFFDAPPPPVNLGPDFEMCLGDSRDFNVFTPDRPSARISYLWEPTGDTTFLYTIREEGTYIVTLTNRCGTVSDAITATTVPPVELVDRPDSTLCEGESIIRDVSWPGATYRWQDGSTSPTRTISSGGLYSVEVANICGVETDSFFIEMIDCACTVHMPTAFSPNGDGINERFTFVQDCMLSNIRLEIYDRWGKQVYSGDGPDASWDGSAYGRPAPEGVYVWVLTYEGRFRRNTLRKHMKGTVTVLR